MCLQSISQNSLLARSAGVWFPSNSGPSPGFVAPPSTGPVPISLTPHFQGILIQYFIQYGSSFYGGGANDPNQPTAAFRIPWAVQMVPAFILLIGLFWFPKSPRWLASKDRWEEALKVLADVHGKGNPNDPVVLAEYKEIEDAIRFEREEQVSDYKELVKPRIFKRVVLGMSIQMWSQLCGMNVMSRSPLPGT